MESLEYAGTKQKVADVIIETDGKKPVRILRVEGNFLTFDENGQVHRDLVASAFAAMETAHALEEALKKPPAKVVDLTAKLNREKWERENRWTLSQEDLDAIADDVWRRKNAAAPRIERAKSAAPVPPKVTWEAKEALREIQNLITSIDNKLRWLSEPALKGLAFEARENAKVDSDKPIWLGVAEAADRLREILVRRRTGQGIWYALVEITRWDAIRRTGETVASFHERCSSKKEAEEAARRLLAEHSKLFSGETSIEAEVLCDLEWDQEAEVKLL